MGRPKGSKNKPKVTLTKYAKGNSLIQVNMEKMVDSAPRTMLSGRGWVNWGMRNDYPLQLSNLYYGSPTHQSCVDFAVAAICGDGIDYDAMEWSGQEEMVPNYQQTWDDFLECLAKDYILYGSYAFQITKNKDGQTYSVYHQPVSDVRCVPYDEDGVISEYFISSDWSELSKYPPVKLRAFNFQEDEEIPKGETFLYVYHSYSPDVLYYQLPRYASAIKAIQAENQLQRYDLRSITNNFTASGLLEVARIEDDEERQEFIDNITAMFQGADNANALMIQFRDNISDKQVEFTKFDKDVNNVNLFEGTNERSIGRILSAHRIPTKQLIGYDASTSMLGGEGNLLNVAYRLYMKTVGNKDQRAIIGTLNKLFRMNGVDIQISIKDLDFTVAGVTSTEEKIDSVNVDKTVTDADNVEEKVTSNNIQ